MIERVKPKLRRLRMKEFVHIMGPKEADNPFSAQAAWCDHDETECTADAPWTPDEDALVVFHLDARHDGDEQWSCRSCGLSTATQANPCAGVFVTRVLQ